MRGTVRTISASLVLGLGVYVSAASPSSADPTSPPTAPPTTSAPQPILPQSKPGTAKAFVPAWVEGTDRRRSLVVHKRAAHLVTRRHIVRYRHMPPLERPTLAGVALVAPLAIPPEPPHFEVPVPAYPLESVAAAFTTAPPPIVCRHAPREPYVPDPHLYRERTVACEPDNP